MYLRKIKHHPVILVFLIIARLYILTGTGIHIMIHYPIKFISIKVNQHTLSLIMDG